MCELLDIAEDCLKNVAAGLRKLEENLGFDLAAENHNLRQQEVEQPEAKLWQVFRREARRTENQLGQEIRYVRIQSSLRNDHLVHIPHRQLSDVKVFILLDRLHQHHAAGHQVCDEVVSEPHVLHHRGQQLLGLLLCSLQRQLVLVLKPLHVGEFELLMDQVAHLLEHLWGLVEIFGEILIAPVAKCDQVLERVEAVHRSQRLEVIHEESPVIRAICWHFDRLIEFALHGLLRDFLPVFRDLVRFKDAGCVIA